jgi:PadR family transcriptional regulator, regulatory protein PadR
MGDAPRLTLQTLAVLNTLLREPRTEKYGLEISKASRLPTGTIYPILARLEGAGWLDSGWEDIDESAEGRRKRRYYRLTGVGIREGRRAAEATRQMMSLDLAGATS